MTTPNPLLAILDQKVANHQAKITTPIPDPVIPIVNSPVVVVKTVTPEVTSVIETPIDNSSIGLDDYIPDIPAPNIETPVEIVDEITPDPNKEINDLLQSDAEKTPSIASRTNFNKLKTHAKTLDEQKKLIETELTTARAQVESYEKGEIVPEVLKNQHERIKELEKWEQIHNQKMSPIYKHAITDPLGQYSDELVDIAEDYNVPIAKVKSLLNIEDEVELNREISKQFKDSEGRVDLIAANDVKNILKNIREIHAVADELEQEPERVFNQLKTEHQQAIERETVIKRRNLANEGKKAWSESWNEIVAEGSASTLLSDKAPLEYVEKHVMPMRQKAAREFGLLMNELGETALDIKPNTIKAIAKMTLLAHEAALANALATSALDDLEETVNGAKRINPLLRPNTGNRSSGLPPAPEPSQPRTAREHGRELINSVLPKR